MFQNETNVLPETPTSVAINNLKNFLQSIGYADASIYIKSDMVYVEFPKKVELSAEQLEEIHNMFYWTKNLKVPYINGLVHFYEYTDTLLISVMLYDKIFKVHEYLNSKGIKLLEFDVCNHEFSFKYDANVDPDFNEEALSEIKQIVDPEDNYRRAVGLFEIKKPVHSYILSIKG